MVQILSERKYLHLLDLRDEFLSSTRIRALEFPRGMTLYLRYVGEVAPLSGKGHIGSVGWMPKSRFLPSECIAWRDNEAQQTESLASWSSQVISAGRQCDRFGRAPGDVRGHAPATTDANSKVSLAVVGVRRAGPQRHVRAACQRREPGRPVRSGCESDREGPRPRPRTAALGPKALRIIASCSTTRPATTPS